MWCRICARSPLRNDWHLNLASWYKFANDVVAKFEEGQDWELTLQTREKLCSGEAVVCCKFPVEYYSSEEEKIRRNMSSRKERISAFFDCLPSRGSKTAGLQLLIAPLINPKWARFHCCGQKHQWYYRSCQPMVDFACEPNRTQYRSKYDICWPQNQ